ncbi:MAG: hypothetical protein KatS3mg063_1058 [Tepidiforma sp.]|nr:MAG: hypothetical protein KatS3mg063_1058 [Tepidiforma sp.]
MTAFIPAFSRFVRPSAIPMAAIGSSVGVCDTSRSLNQTESAPCSSSRSIHAWYAPTDENGNPATPKPMPMPMSFSLAKPYSRTNCAKNRVSRAWSPGSAARSPRTIGRG